MKKVLITGVLACSLSACGMTAHSGDHFVMSGTPEGIRAFSDTLNGAMRTAKESPKADSKYFAFRADYEKHATTRAVSPGFFQKLLGGDK